MPPVGQSFLSKTGLKAALNKTTDNDYASIWSL